jgi:MYXO-CTERM domain-containing protein
MNRNTYLFGGILVAVGVAAPAALAVNTPPHLRTHRNMNGNPVIPGGDAVLYDQTINPIVNNFVDQEFGDFPSFSAYLVDDFKTGGQTWNVTSVSTYFTGYGSWGGITTGKLQVYTKSGNIPSNGSDIAPEYTVPVVVSNVGGSWEVKADTSGIAELQGINGDYWVGLTPVADFGKFGQNFHLLQDLANGDQTAGRNPGGAFGFPNWTHPGDVIGGGPYDMSFRLDGDVVPAPGAAALLGLGGLVAGRRRRA